MTKKITFQPRHPLVIMLQSRRVQIRRIFLCVVLALLLMLYVTTGYRTPAVDSSWASSYTTRPEQNTPSITSHPHEKYPSDEKFQSDVKYESAEKNHSYEKTESDGKYKSEEKYAFVTFLNAPFDDVSRYSFTNSTKEDPDNDGYYISTRVLVYSLLHHYSTRSSRPIPVIVLVTSQVSEAKKARLEADGAEVITTNLIEVPGWTKAHEVRHKDVISKLHMFTFTQYDKICHIEADHLVTAPLDGVFDDPATTIVPTQKNSSRIKPDEPELPSRYMFASKAAIWDQWHPVPPPLHDWMNSGFLAFHPSMELYEYYMGLLQIQGRFLGFCPEQGLWNYAHRRDGNMPWTDLHWTWNVNDGTFYDYEAGTKSFHNKFWQEGHNAIMRLMWRKRFFQMMDYYQLKENPGSSIPAPPVNPQSPQVRNDEVVVVDGILKSFTWVVANNGVMMASPPPE